MSTHDFTEPGRVEQIGRELADKIAARFRAENAARFIEAIDEARHWLREGAPGKALEVLDAARERVK